MDGLNFTVLTAFKLLAGILIFGVWLMAHQQSKVDERYRKEREEAKKIPGARVPGKRIIPRSNIILVVITIIFLVIVLFCGNDVTI